MIHLTLFMCACIHSAAFEPPQGCDVTRAWGVVYSPMSAVPHVARLAFLFSAWNFHRSADKISFPQRKEGRPTNHSYYFPAPGSHLILYIFFFRSLGTFLRKARPKWIPIEAQPGYRLRSYWLSLPQTSLRLWFFLRKKTSDPLFAPKII